jgi:hypothetical protein
VIEFDSHGQSALRVGFLAEKNQSLIDVSLVAEAIFKRDDFSLDDGKAYGFNMDVTLRWSD